MTRVPGEGKAGRELVCIRAFRNLRQCASRQPNHRAERIFRLVPVSFCARPFLSRARYLTTAVTVIKVDRQQIETLFLLLGGRKRFDEPGIQANFSCFRLDRPKESSPE